MLLRSDILSRLSCSRLARSQIERYCQSHVEHQAHCALRYRVNGLLVLVSATDAEGRLAHIDTVVLRGRISLRIEAGRA